jgi:hypothetical protein
VVGGVSEKQEETREDRKFAVGRGEVKRFRSMSRFEREK